LKTAYKISCICAVAFVFCANAFGVDFPPKPNQLVNDLANLMSPADHAKLETELRQYEKDTSIEIAVLTVTSLQGLPPEDYAVQLFSSWGIGKKGKDNGILLLFAPTEKKVRIEVGYGLEPYLTDGASGDIIRQSITPTYRSGKVSESIVDGAEAIRDHLGKKTYEDRAKEREQAAFVPPPAPPLPSDSNDFDVWIVAAVIIVVIGAALLFYKKVTSRNRGDAEYPPVPMPGIPRDRSQYPARTDQRPVRNDPPREPEEPPAKAYVAPVRDDEDEESKRSPDSDSSSNSDPDPPSFDFGGGSSGGGGATGDL
jgi:uncharacterized protein